MRESRPQVVGYVTVDEPIEPPPAEGPSAEVKALERIGDELTKIASCLDDIARATLRRG